MKTVIITGASRGIGLATAKKFLEEGWFVIGTYLNIKIPIKDKNFIAVKYNQGDPESIEGAVEEIRNITSEINALVNNAAIMIDAKDQITNPVKTRDTFEVNVVGVIDFTERILPFLKKGDHILNISSDYGVVSKPVFDTFFSTAYRISKAALNMYTRQLAFRLTKKGIIVSAFVPGWVKTDMGHLGETDTEKPYREPEQVAKEIFDLITTVKETNQIWYLGKKSEW